MRFTVAKRECLGSGLVDGFEVGALAGAGWLVARLLSVDAGGGEVLSMGAEVTLERNLDGPRGYWLCMVLSEFVRFLNGIEKRGKYDGE